MPWDLEETRVWLYYQRGIITAAEAWEILACYYVSTP